MALTEKQRRFAREYMVDRCGAKAAVRAGFSERTAKVKACALLKRPEIAALVEAHEAELAARTAVTAERVIAELAKIAFSDPGQFFTETGALKRIEDMDEDARASLAAVDIVTRKVPGGDDGEVEHVAKIRLWDKRAALVDLGKHLGLFKDKIELTGTGGDPLRIVISPDDARL